MSALDMNQLLSRLLEKVADLDADLDEAKRDGADFSGAKGLVSASEEKAQ